MDQDETDRLARLHSLAERNFLRVRWTGGAAFEVTAGARGRVVCTGDLVTVEQWLLLDNERIDAEVRHATRSQADLELEEMTLEGMSGARAATGREMAGHPRPAVDGDRDVDTSVVVHCAVITGQLSALSELLFRNPGALGDGDDPLHITEFTAILRRAADTLDRLLPGQ